MFTILHTTTILWKESVAYAPCHWALNSHFKPLPNLLLYLLLQGHPGQSGRKYTKLWIRVRNSYIAPWINIAPGTIDLVPWIIIDYSIWLLWHLDLVKNTPPVLHSLSSEGWHITLENTSMAKIICVKNVRFHF